MKLGITSTNSNNIEEIKRNFETIKLWGYDCVDYQGLSNLNNDFHKMDEQSFKLKMLEIKELAKANGLEIYQLHGAWPTLEIDNGPKGEDPSHQAYIREIYGASLLGCPNVVIHPYMEYGYNVEKDFKVLYEGTKNRLIKLIPYCKKYNVNVCIENMPFTACKTSKIEVLRQMVDEINDPHIYLCLDTGHANVFNQDAAEAVKIAGSRLKCVHIHDNMGDGDFHLLPLCGTIDFVSFSKTLKEINFPGVFSLETGITKKYPDNIKDEMNRLLFKMVKILSDVK